MTRQYIIASSETPTQNLTGQDLGGLTLLPGVRDFSSSAQLTGNLILDAQGTANAQFVFQIGSTFTTASAASVELINGAQADNVFWQVGSSATIGTYSVIYGNILADASITLTTGASLTGRALALNGAVTMDDNVVSIETVPEPNSFLAGALCLITFGAGKGLSLWRQRKP
jgi:type VI secretion system secreted protein VgrG